MTVQEWLGNDNAMGISIYERKYRHKNETFDEWLDRVSGKDAELKKLIKERKFLFGGRALSNRGTPDSDGSMFNCYSAGFAPDDTDGLLELNRQLGVTYKAQGGQGVSLTQLRPKGTAVGDRFVSDGIVPFMEIFNTTTSQISQGGSRKGALMMSLDIRHKEAEEFITIKTETGRIEKANLSLEIDDEFMDAVNLYYNTGEEIVLHEKRVYSGHEVEYDLCPIKLYKKMISTAHEWGEPGCLFTEKLRNYNIMQYVNDYVIETTNPSLRKGTEVLTSDGVIPIEQLEGKNFYVQTLNGELAKAECFLSGKNKKLYRLDLNNGYSYYATKEHKWPILNNGRHTKTFTSDLVPGDLIPITYADSLPFGSEGTYDDGFFIGYWYGDGSVTQRKDDGRLQYNLTFGKEKAECGLLNSIIKKLENITHKKINFSTRNRGGEDWYEICCGDKLLADYMLSNGVVSKHLLPDGMLTNKSENFRKGFIDGLFSSDGNVDLIGGGRLGLVSCNREFIEQIKSLLMWYGIKGTITRGRTNLNGKEFDRFAYRMGQYESVQFRKAFTLSHTRKQELLNSISTPIRERKLKTHVRVSSVTETDIYEDVWDIHVYDESHTFRLCGCITGNCGEQPLPKHSCCNLGSLNLGEYVSNPYTPQSKFEKDEFLKDVEIAIRALDDILDENAERHPLQIQKENSLKWRNIGLGVMGYGTALLQMSLRYGSEDALRFTEKLFKDMFRTAVDASCALAEEKGAFPGYDPLVWESDIMKFAYGNEGNWGKPLRNCSLISIAPTGSISNLLGVTGGCEPEYALSYTRKTESLNGGEPQYFKVFCNAAREYMRINKTDILPEWFVSSANIDWKDRIKTQAEMQKYVDTAISSTVNLAKETTVEDIEQLYLYAWKEGLKGVTIFRDGCKRLGILTTETPSEHESESHPLPRGFIMPKSDDLVGKLRTLTTGCGSLHVTAFFDPFTGDFVHTFLSKGSSGGCQNFMVGLSRMISLAARGGVSLEDIVDQLNSCGSCSSYAVRSATKHDASKGSCCPMAIGNALTDMHNEMMKEICADEPEEKIEQEPTILKPVQKAKQPINPCPSCGEELVFEGGCNSCKSCGYSKCS